MTDKNTNTNIGSRVIAALRGLLPDVQSQHDRDQLYLADAVDIFDLERRMREVDGRSRYPQVGLPLGLGLR